MMPPKGQGRKRRLVIESDGRGNVRSPEERKEIMCGIVGVIGGRH
jgi:hypothetical protein